MRKSLVAILAAALVVAVAAPVGAGAETKERPFHGEFIGYLVGFNEDRSDIEARCADPENTWAVSTFEAWGDVTHLGYSHVVAVHCSYIDPPGTYGEGLLSVTADNGDVLLATYGPGFSIFDPTSPIIGFEDDFEFIDGGTGRFVTAGSGGSEIGWFNVVTGEFGVAMEGTIIYDASNRKSK